MSNASCIPRAPTEKIDKLFGRRFLYNRDATMAATPTASPILLPLLKMRVEPSYWDRSSYNSDWKTVEESYDLFPSICMDNWNSGGISSHSGMEGVKFIALLLRLISKSNMCWFILSKTKWQCIVYKTNWHGLRSMSFASTYDNGMISTIM